MGNKLLNSIIKHEIRTAINDIIDIDIAIINETKTYVYIIMYSGYFSDTKDTIYYWKKENKFEFNLEEVTKKQYIEIELRLFNIFRKAKIYNILRVVK